jgi:hypothetical protein
MRQPEAKQGILTGQPSQVQPEPQPQEPEEAHPQPDMMMVVFFWRVVVLKIGFVCVDEVEMWRRERKQWADERGELSLKIPRE